MKTFGEALREIIVSKGLSVSAAAMELGFRSKTALFRILGDECRSATSRKCMEAARASKLLALTPQEVETLERALEVNEIGRHTYAMNGVLRSMIRACPPPEQTEPIAVDGIEGISTMRELIDACKTMPGLSVTILGRCSPDILSQLYGLADALPERGIRHILAINERSVEDIQAFAETAFMLFTPAYSLGVMRESEFEESFWAFRSRMIVIGGDNERGERTVYQLMYVGDRRYVGYKDETGGLCRHWAKIGEHFGEKVDDLNGHSTGAGGLPFPENFVHLCERCLQVEAGREILMIRPDIPVMCVPPEIFMASIVDRFDGQTASSMARYISRAEAIHAARYENFMAKKKPSHLIVEEEAMRRFARTGLCADHVYLARAFTPQERRTILRALMGRTRKNTGLRLWFSKPGMATDGREVAAYDRFGIALVKPNTSWRLDGDHREMLLTSEFLASSMRDFVHTQVLKKEVLPASETARILDELIELTREGE